MLIKLDRTNYNISNLRDRAKTLNQCIDKKKVPIKDAYKLINNEINQLKDKNSTTIYYYYEVMVELKPSIDGYHKLKNPSTADILFFYLDDTQIHF